MGLYSKVTIGCISLSDSRIFLGVVVGYDYDCGGGVFFGDHSCQAESF